MIPVDFDDSRRGKFRKKEGHMHQLVRAMSVASLFAAGLPLSTGAANAQTPYTWYQFTPSLCEADLVYRESTGSWFTDLYLGVFLNGTYTYIYVPDSPIISALYKSCTDGSGFYAYYAGPAAGWTSFYTYPGLK
jgi:hypothetical protein